MTNKTKKQNSLIYGNAEYKKSYEILETACCDLNKKHQMYNAINTTKDMARLNELGFGYIFASYQMYLRDLVIIAVSNLFSKNSTVISIKKLIDCTDFPKDKKAEVKQILIEIESDIASVNSRRNKQVAHISRELLEEKFLEENILTNNIVKNIIDKLPRLFDLVSINERYPFEKGDHFSRTTYSLQRIATLEKEYTVPDFMI